MNELEEFALERFFAEHEFTAPYLMCCSDCETVTIRDLLENEPNSTEELLNISLHYTESLGDPKLRKQIASLYQSISEENILVDAGAQSLILATISRTLTKGDHLIVQFPCYTSLTDLAKWFGVEVSLWECDPDNQWKLDTQQLKNLIQPNTKMLIVNSPNNPTGYLMSSAEFSQVIDICKDHQLIFFSDEVYRGLESADVRLAPACDLYENAISLGVMSKSYGLAGLRLGWIATRNNQLYQKIAMFKDYTSICTAAPSEYLSRIAIKHGEKLIQRNLQIVERNKALFAQFAEQHSDFIRWVPPIGGPVGFAELLGVASSKKFCDQLVKQSGVLLAPGSAFHVTNRAFVRVGLGRENFPQVLTVLENFLRQSKAEFLLSQR